jgi:hypothetical protein
MVSGMFVSCFAQSTEYTKFVLLLLLAPWYIIPLKTSVAISMVWVSYSKVAIGRFRVLFRTVILHFVEDNFEINCRQQQLSWNSTNIICFLILRFILLVYLIWGSIKLELKEARCGVWTAFIWLRGFYERSPSFRVAFIMTRKFSLCLWGEITYSGCSKK